MRRIFASLLLLVVSINGVPAQEQATEYAQNLKTIIDYAEKRGTTVRNLYYVWGELNWPGTSQNTCTGVQLTVTQHLPPSLLGTILSLRGECKVVFNMPDLDLWVVAPAATVGHPGREKWHSKRSAAVIEFRRPNSDVSTTMRPSAKNVHAMFEKAFAEMAAEMTASLKE